MIGQGIRAHAAGVGAAVAVKSSFVILHQRCADNGFAVAQTLQRKFLAVEFFFDDQG